MERISSFFWKRIPLVHHLVLPGNRFGLSYPRYSSTAFFRQSMHGCAWRIAKRYRIGSGMHHISVISGFIASDLAGPLEKRAGKPAENNRH